MPARSRHGSTQRPSTHPPIFDLSHDLLSKVLAQLPTVECVARFQRVSRVFALPASPGARSAIEDALRLRAVLQTGCSVPRELPLGDRWGTWKQQLFFLERCRRGLCLRPLPGHVWEAEVAGGGPAIIAAAAEGTDGEPSALAMAAAAAAVAAGANAAVAATAMANAAAAAVAALPPAAVAAVAAAVTAHAAAPPPAAAASAPAPPLDGEEYAAVEAAEAGGSGPAAPGPAAPEVTFSRRPDGRHPIFLLRSSCELARPTSMLLGRATRSAESIERRAINGQSIKDPRVSRRHAELSLYHRPKQPPAERHEPPELFRHVPQPMEAYTACLGQLDTLGHNPSRLASEWRVSPTGQARVVTSKRERRLRRGDRGSPLCPGDVLHLVCEEVSRAHERSAPYDGNSCAYRVELITEYDMLMIARAHHREGGLERDSFDFFDLDPMPSASRAFLFGPEVLDWGRAPSPGDGPSPPPPSQPVDEEPRQEEQSGEAEAASPETVSQT